MSTLRDHGITKLNQPIAPLYIPLPPMTYPNNVKPDKTASWTKYGKKYHSLTYVWQKQHIIYTSKPLTFNNLIKPTTYAITLRAKCLAYYMHVYKWYSTHTGKETTNRRQQMINRLEHPNSNPNLRSDTPSIWLMVEEQLKLFGGWSRMFGKSRETYDKEVIYSKEKEIGFWQEYALALSQEQFAEYVEETIIEFREAYPDNETPKKELRELLAKAILEDGWRPVKKPIMEEISRLRRQKKDELRALRGGRTKKEWQKHLSQQRRLNNGKN